VFVSADSEMREMRDSSAVVRVRGKHLPLSPNYEDERKSGEPRDAFPNQHSETLAKLFAFFPSAQKIPSFFIRSMYFKMLGSS
jgi:hypothetical protein